MNNDRTADTADTTATTPSSDKLALLAIGLTLLILAGTVIMATFYQQAYRVSAEKLTQQYGVHIQAPESRFAGKEDTWTVAGVARTCKLSLEPYALLCTTSQDPDTFADLDS